MVVVQMVEILQVVRLVGHLQLRFAIVEFVDACILQTRFYTHHQLVLTILKS
jgi:hypothetical protein